MRKKQEKQNKEEDASEKGSGHLMSICTAPEAPPPSIPVHLLKPLSCTLLSFNILS